MTVTASYTYNAVDNLLEINQDGQIRNFVYDMLGRVKSETTPEGGTLAFTYTDFDAPLKRTHAARGVETHYGYDSLNRANKVWYTGIGGNDSGTIRPALPSTVAATSDIDITYNSSAPGNGQPLSVSDGQIAGFSSSESYVYESLTGRLQSRTRAIDGNSYQTQYQYNGMSQVTLMIYPSGKNVRMNYDSRGRMLGEDKVDTAGNVVTAYASNISYNVPGLLTGVSLGNGVNETYGYSSDRLQLTGQTAVKGASTLMNLTYGYAAAAGDSGATTTAGNSGQLMSIGGTIASAARNQAFTYDNVARLKTASGWSAWSQGYSYDNKNNLTSISGTQPKTISVDGATNRIQNVNGIGYSYDAAGNVTSDGVHNYQYDAAGRLAKVDAGSANEAAYFYDSQNWRVKKVLSGNTTNYIWEGARVIAEYGTAPPQGSGGLKYYHQDRLSTRTITNATGTVVGTSDTLPYGESFATSGEVEKHRFTNYERDSESNTDYAVNRQYAMGIGRFMRPDPLMGSPGDPQSFNRYAYVRNDPINLLDPLGLECVEVCTPTPGGGRTCTWSCNISAGDSSIIPIVSGVSGIGPFGPGELPVVALDVLSLLPQVPTPIPQQKPIWCRPDVIKAMNTAWSQSGNAGQARASGSMGVEAGFNLNGTPSNYRIGSSYTNETGKMSIKFSIGGSWPTFANFHIHPGQGTSGMPSTPGNNYEGNPEGDTGRVDRFYSQHGQAVKIYVMSWHGLAMYDPATKAPSVQLVKGTGFLKGEGCPH
jgi:RHS repeat-associated protein